MEMHSFILQMNSQTQITKGSREQERQDEHILYFAIEMLWLTR